jgi:hypothetical protein
VGDFVLIEGSGFILLISTLGLLLILFLLYRMFNPLKCQNIADCKKAKLIGHIEIDKFSI